MPEVKEIEESLRSKLRCLDEQQGNRIVKSWVGRTDLAQYIMSFVESERPLVDTDVGGKMFVDSGSANVDLCFHSVPSNGSTKRDQLEERLQKAWDENCEVCLKQIFLIGASREGKQDRYTFYDALLWLWQKDQASSNFLFWRPTLITLTTHFLEVLSSGYELETSSLPSR